MFSEIQLPVNQQVFLPQLDQKEIQLFIKREDQIHQQISGNKYRKLKYNLREAKGKGYKRLITFGGIYTGICLRHLFHSLSRSWHLLGSSLPLHRWNIA